MERLERIRKQQELAAIRPLTPKSCCNCKSKLDPYQLFDENIEDIATSMAQIMLICGINTSKSYNAKPIIKRAFVYHEKLRTRCPPEANRSVHLNREDMLQALRIKCEMQSVEAMLSYAIIKRGFKAFFHGKPPTTISNPIVDAMAIHQQEAAWMHAAYKTSRIFDNYKAAFFWAHKSYEKQINLVYRSLYKRMRARSDPLLIPGCPCRHCQKQEVPGHPKYGEPPREKLHLADCADLPEACMLCGLQVPQIKTKVKVKPPRPILNHELNLPRCETCNSPFLICECNIDQLTGEQFGECGQDSYKVKWYRLEEEPSATAKAPGADICSEDTLEEATTDWDNHHCPIDCKHDSCSESSNVCHEQSKTGDSDDEESDSDGFQSCSEEANDEVAKLEAYLNKLWAEELAEKKNPKTFKSSLNKHECKVCRRE